METEQEYILGPDPSQGGFAMVPLRRVHMLAGASGTGKTRWLFQLLKAMYAGENFMGFQTQRHPVVYCAFDRQVDEQEETMRAVGLDPALVPHKWLKVPDLPRDKSRKDDRFEIIVRDLKNEFPATTIFIFDALYILAAHGEMNNYVIMAEWLQRLGEMCRAQDITIIGVVHSPKQRKGNEITDPRYTAQGSVATGGFTSTQIVIESPSQDDPDKRMIHIYPRNAKEDHISMVMGEGGIFGIDEAEEDGNLFYLETTIMAGLAPGAAIPLRDIASTMKSKLNVSKSATQRYLGALVECGKVCKYGRGMYGPRSQAGQEAAPKAQGPAAAPERDASTEASGNPQGELSPLDRDRVGKEEWASAAARFDGMAGQPSRQDAALGVGDDRTLTDILPPWKRHLW